MKQLVNKNIIYDSHVDFGTSCASCWSLTKTQTAGCLWHEGRCMNHFFLFFSRFKNKTTTKAQKTIYIYTYIYICPLNITLVYSLQQNILETLEISNQSFEGWVFETHRSTHARNLSQHASVETVQQMAALGDTFTPAIGTRLGLSAILVLMIQNRGTKSDPRLHGYLGEDNAARRLARRRRRDTEHDDSHVVFCFRSAELLISGADSSASPSVCSYSHPSLSCLIVRWCVFTQLLVQRLLSGHTACKHFSHVLAAEVF